MELNSSRTVSASSGWQWINQGVRYFLSSKMNWLSALLVVAMLSIFLIRVAPVFRLALVFILPFIAAGLSMACADIEQGKKMSLEYLIKGFSNSNKFNIFRYGLLFMLMMIVSQLISSLILNVMGINSEQLLQAIELLKTNNEQPLSAILASPVLTQSFIVSIITLIPLMVINLLAPIILAFSNYTPLDVIKMSFAAGIRNIPAFFVYGSIYLVMIFTVVVVLQFLMSLLLSIFGPNSSIAIIIYMFIFITCILSIASLSYCSAYVAFKDLFVGDEN